MDVNISAGIDWVGHIDWGVRDFHGYKTDAGSTYNAYLIRDEKTALIDTVKGIYSSGLLARVAQLTDLSAIRYVICNHAEPDHSGGLSAVMAVCRNAELVCDARCRDALQMHYDTNGWKWRIVSDGESISLGKRSMSFLETPMVHWPESMFTYVPEEKLLFSMDAFGQHYASSCRFDDEEPLDKVMREAKKYYANIVMLYGRQIAKVLERAAGLEIKIIAPSHGVIWRKNLDVILSAYRDWVVCRPVAKVLVIYDTMWKSTELMAEAIVDGVAERGVDVRLFNVRNTHITTLAEEVLDCAALAVGSPTLNMTLMPQVAAALTYLNGLKPAGKCGMVFGSYGWAKGGIKAIEEYMASMNVEMVGESIEVQFVPTEDVLEKCRNAGRMLADRALGMVDNL